MPNDTPVTQEYLKIENCSFAGGAARQEGPWMKFQSVLLGVFFCLAAQSAGPPGRIAQLANPSDSKAQQVTGCLDDEMVKIASLQPGGSDLGIGYTCH